MSFLRPELNWCCSDCRQTKNHVNEIKSFFFPDPLQNTQVWKNLIHFFHGVYHIDHSGSSLELSIRPSRSGRLMVNWFTDSRVSFLTSPVFVMCQSIEWCGPQLGLKTPTSMKSSPEITLVRLLKNIFWNFDYHGWRNCGIIILSSKGSLVNSFIHFGSEHHLWLPKPSVFSAALMTFICWSADRY